MDIKGILLIAAALLVTALWLLLPISAPGPEAQLIVALGDEDSIGIVDLARGKLTAKIPVGPATHGVTLLPGRGLLYATSFGSDEVSVVDPAQRKTIAKVDVGGKSHHLTASPDGKYVYVAVASTNNVAVIDTTGNAVVTQITVGQAPGYVVFTPEGKFAYVTNMGGGTVTVIDVAQSQVIATIEVGQKPDHMAVTPDGRYAYVTEEGMDQVSVIDTARNQVITTISVGSGPHGVAVTADGKSVFVGNRGTTTLSIIDVATKQIKRTIDLGVKPEHIIAPPQGNWVCVGSVPAQSLFILEATSGKLLKKIQIGSELHQMDVAMLSSPVGGTHTKGAQSSEAELTRSSHGGGIEVSATYMNPITKDRDLVFKVALDTHFGSLSAIDLTERAILRSSGGMVIDSGFAWEPISESSHHRLGYLKAPPTVKGVALIGQDTKYIELELREIGIPSRVFKWESAALTPGSY